MLLPAMAFSFGFGYHCGVEENRHILGLPYLYDASEAGDEVNIYLVFVSFDDGTGVVPPITEDFHGTFLDVMRDWLPAATYNKLQVSEESKILLPYGVEFSGGTANTWLAAAPIECYTSGDFDEETYPAQYLEAHAWGSSGELPSEIMCQIYDDYWVEHGIDLFSDSGNSSVGWEVHFVYLRDPDPSVVFEPLGHGVGGVPGVYLSPDSVPEMFGDYFDGLTTYPGSFIRYAGTQNIVPYVPEYYDGDGNSNFVEIDCDAHPYVCNKDMFVRTWVHEYVHTWGVFDGPPNLNTSDDVLPVLAQYFYGNLHIECQHMPAMSRIDIHEDFEDPPSGYQKFRGIPPLADPALARLPLNTGGAAGAPSVINFTGECLRDVEIEDVSTGGQLYRYDLGVREDGQDEYFIIAYHAGLGLDQQYQYDDPSDGRSTVPSQGVAIWHCIGRTMWDLESASGLYDYGRDGDHDGQPIFVYPDDGIGVEADRVLGYDNYDRWYYRNSAGSIVQRGDVASHDGRDTDFFLWNEADPSSRAHVFSYATNPNNFGYEDPGIYVVRRSSQNVPNTLIVNVKETVGGNAVKVDLLSAPGEVVTPEILAGEVYQVGQRAETFVWSDSWSHNDDIDAYDLEYTTVEVYFLGVAGGEYEKIGELPFSAQSYVWTPGPGHNTTQGKLQFRFYNSLIPSSFGYYDLPQGDGRFIVEGGYTEVCEQLASPNGGEELFPGPIDVYWTNNYESQQGLLIHQVDIGYSLDDGESPVWPVEWVFERDGTNPWDPGSGAEPNHATITLDPTHAGDSVRLHLRTHFDPGGGYDPVVNEDESDGALAVYPVMYTFESGVGDSGIDYAGDPGGTSLAFLDAGNAVDLIVACIDDPDQAGAKSEIYTNTSVAGQIGFVNSTEDLFASTQAIPQVGYHAVAAADVDEDGVTDLFMAHDTDPRLYVVDASGYWTNVVSVAQWFDPSQKWALQDSRMAVWVDYDHDGDLDLFVGRTNGPTMFENRGEGEIPRFFDVTDASGLRIEDSFAVTDCVWCDYDNDGRWNVAISFYGSEVIFFEEAALGCFVVEENTSSLTPELPDYYVFDDMELSDVDMDNDMDYVALRGGYLAVSVNESNTWTRLTPDWMALGGGKFGVQACDLDRDGAPELMTVSGTETPSQVGINLINRPTFSGVPYVFVDEPVALDSGTAEAGALAAADFDLDGDIDLMIGVGGPGDTRVKKLVNRVDGESMSGKSLKIKLVGLEDNIGGLGALVSLVGAGDVPMGAQCVSGEGDRSGQPSPMLHFGLGDYVGGLSVDIRWPLGRRQSYPIQIDAQDLDTTIEIAEEVDLEVIEGTVAFSAVVGPVMGGGGKVDWVFEWRTDHWSDLNLDQVNVLYMPPDCIGQDYDLQHDPDSGITVTVKYDAKVDPPQFRHKLVWSDAPCLPGCSFSYYVSSHNGLPGGVRDTSSSLTGIMPRLCPTELGGE